MTIRLTPEQRSQLARFKSQLPRLDLDPQQRSELLRAIAEEQAARPSNEVKLSRIMTAEKDSGLSGLIRRAISQSGRPINELADEIGVDARLLDHFRMGEQTLTTDVIDRLVNVLGLQLVSQPV
jgi:ribosome-binding protein aMBF1 (putative translation factor)